MFLCSHSNTHQGPQISTQVSGRDPAAGQVGVRQRRQRRPHAARRLSFELLLELPGRGSRGGVNTAVF